MKQVYANINVATGPHIAGICKVLIAPKEWLQNNLLQRFADNIITDGLLLQDNKKFIYLNLLQYTFDFEEKQKSNKSGSYFDISLTGTCNNIDAFTQQILNVYRYHEFVVVFKDKQSRYRVAGNKIAGMQLQFSNKENSNNGGTQLVNIDLSFQHEQPVPFCNWPVIQISMPELKTNTVTHNSILCEWDAMPPATRYLLERATDVDFTMNITAIYSGGALSFTDTPLNANTTYYYRLTAMAPEYINSVYSTNSNTTAQARTFDNTFDNTFN